MMTRASTENPIRILIVDDHELVRDGIRARLADEKQFLILGEAPDGEQAVRMAQEMEPDFIMMDVSMPNMNGLDATRAIRKAQIKSQILILSIFDSHEYVRDALGAGANGYILKDVSSEEMVRALLTVGGGGLYLSTDVAASVYADTTSQNSADFIAPYGLTAREKDVLKAVADGKANKDIGALLGISVRTVESHRQNLREKLGGGNAAHLAKIAHELGL